jgi:hypothetical protein
MHLPDDFDLAKEVDLALVLGLLGSEVDDAVATGKVYTRRNGLEGTTGAFSEETHFLTH